MTTTDLRTYIVWLRARRNSRTGQPISEDTVNGYLRALHAFWRWSAAEYGSYNPMARIAYPRTRQSKPKAITRDDVALMFNACGDDLIGVRNRALLALLIDTGMRAGGLCGLTMDRLDLKNRRALVIEKGSKERLVLFTSATTTVLERWLAIRLPVPFLFYNLKTGGRLTVDGLRQVLGYIGQRAGVQGRCNPHSFRHFFAREYLTAGGDLATLSKLLGHNQTSTTIGYYTLFSDNEIAERHEKYSPLNLFAISGGQREQSEGT